MGIITITPGHLGGEMLKCLQVNLEISHLSKK